MNAERMPAPRCSERDDSRIGARPQGKVLLTVLGTQPRPALYSLGDRQTKARLAPVALFGLLPEAERPDRVFALCTPQAKRDSWPLLRQALQDRSEVAAVDVPAGSDQGDVDSFLARLSAAVPEKVDLTVDVTHGFRHFSFLTYIGVLYLAALRRVRVRGAYYGLLEKSGPSPFLDLRPLLELPRWLHALKTLRDTGSTRSMAEILLEHSKSQLARTIATELARFSEGYLSGLPLEAGRQAHLIREQRIKPLKKLLKKDHHLPLSEKLVEQLDGILQPFSLREPASGGGWKSRTALSRAELERQARLIDDLLRRGSTPTALGLMNEWTISWAALTTGDEKKWLDRKVRQRAKGLLHAIKAIGADPELAPVLTAEQRSLGKFWGHLCDLRNAYAHHGMRGQVVVGDKGTDGQLKKTRGFWKKTLRSCPDLPLSLGQPSGRRVLVSPVGLRPGVLFSALRTCRADRHIGDPELCLAICSHETEALTGEAARRAGYNGELEPLLLDPHGGHREIGRLAKAARKHFIGAERVFVNVTGGTTLMGLAAEALGGAARKLACSVRRFGLIDRRPPARQDADPYRAGEPFWLDPDQDDDVHDD